MGNVLNAARQTYDRLWREAIPHFERGAAQIDPHLTNRAGDVRRGVTLALRLESAVQEAVELFLRQLAVSAPGQYFCRPDELHVTVLAAIHAIIGKVLKRRRPFAISFRGITALQGAVMIQGFPQGGALAEIRDELRRVLRKNHLGGDIDRRYKINTAHITVMRFGHARTDWKAFVGLLKANRKTDFGETHVRELQLPWGDWYASAHTVRTIQEYPLADPSRTPA